MTAAPRTTGSGTSRPAASPDVPPARAGRAEAARFVAARTVPGFARPRAMRAYAATLRALRARHGGAPVLVRGLSGTVLVLLDPQDMRQFYAEPVSCPAPDAQDPQAPQDPPDRPDPPDPHKSLIRRDHERREEQRRINDQVLAAGAPVHPSCGPFLGVIAEEARHLTAADTLRLARARSAVARTGRRIVLGDAAAGDEELAGWLSRLRGAGNWPGLRKARGRAARTVYDRTTARIAEYAARAEPHTLVGRARGHADPAGQACHWLLAMDTVPGTLLRTLLLLGAHPAEQDTAAAEARAAGARAGGAALGELPRLRACVRESLRLYPVVPDLIRVTRAETEWRGVRYPAGTSVLLPALFHQRDPEHVPAAHVFVPGRWTTPGADRDIRMAPFSHGAGRCPGDQLGLLVTAALCAEVLRGHRVAGGRPVLDPPGPLPATLDPQGIRLTLTRR
ncbi:cytochrome P450 [Streptomyces sp. ISL-86]|uniref:cytochrome P450 n=1 Tax=Streptomyces sp. ISL-86 TaxID=2819187 RepID=UPI001BE62429|nr:cytochrome P450 [Streptomyces sp. ISL-86]MBT2459557.1 cytochrome P450 [Streptomyces sp. ISL-86]